jgi:hypothetical protein
MSEGYPRPFVAREEIGGEVIRTEMMRAQSFGKTDWAKSMEYKEKLIEGLQQQLKEQRLEFHEELARHRKEIRDLEGLLANARARLSLPHRAAEVSR